MAVVRLSEAIELRDAGITKPILLMGPFDDADLEEAVLRDVMPMVYTEVGDALARLATRRQSADPGAGMRGYRDGPGRRSVTGTRPG